MMKAIFYYSEKQYQHTKKRANSEPCILTFINGKQYTELFTCPPYEPNWDDAVIVGSFDNLPINHFTKRHIGKEHADILSIVHLITYKQIDNSNWQDIQSKMDTGL